ncbi:hypothetical protein FNF29_04393 [Cafeteria roenbergensis]|uniref:Poly A polymerase head domain-containing protein n=1 Tax=Cafeteria roenbergensis TaxID=33653 RepID=A0A5A8CFI2_CAFRO|nr:hypothetical protein FNF29_04393 [Cafeteria roenbergensis]|eukprot:KAA0151706.1 hypothetical protein FNF29_04393 [Cafeteria roenbergensis]
MIRAARVAFKSLRLRPASSFVQLFGSASSTASRLTRQAAGRLTLASASSRGVAQAPHPSSPVSDPRRSKRLRVPIVMASGDIVAEHEISLTDLEQRIFGVLKRVLEQNGLRTVVRVAGGWVRDKVLGKENHDIDLALDDMTGSAFAEAVNATLASSGERTHTVNVIQANPEQSKHLETATTCVLGMQLDFVNLRTEEYAADSRIPTARFGTATEDALRRDFTINALFYNVNEGTIEDLTGHSFADLRAGVVRTPLPPVTTLLDDPLRVMRAVRFAARFGFRLAGDLREALELPEVRSALAGKVSRERVGAELDNMLASARPVGALRMLQARGLMPVVLALPRLVSRASAEELAAAHKEAKAPVTGKAAKKRQAAAAAAAAEGAAPSPEEAAAAAAAAEWVMAPVEAPERPSAAVSAVIANGMLLVDTVDAALSDGLAAPDAAAAMPPAAAPGAVRPTKVVRRDGIAAEDAGRAASIEATRAEEEAAAAAAAAAEGPAAAAAAEAQQLPDHVGVWRGLADDSKRALLLAALLWPLRDAWALGTDSKERGKAVTAVTAVVRFGLKRRARDCDDVNAIHKAVPLFLDAARRCVAAGLLPAEQGAAWEPAPTEPSAADSAWSSAAAPAAAAAAAGAPADAPAAVRCEEDIAPDCVRGVADAAPLAEAFAEAAAKAEAADDPVASARLALGLAVSAAGPLSDAAAFLAGAVAAASPLAAGAEERTRAEMLALLRPGALAAAATATAMTRLVKEQGLADAWQWKALVDGKALRGMGVRPGPAMRPLMEAQALWRLARPGCSAADCEAAIRRWVEAEQGESAASR